MDVYYFVIIFTFILCYTIKVPYDDQNTYRRKVILVFMPIMIFGALRVDFGVDYSQYETWYYEWHDTGHEIDSDLHAEIIYQWLNIVMPTWRSLLILVSGSIVGAFMMMYSKYVEPNMLMLAVVFTMLYPDQSFFLQFVSMRCGLAIAGTWLCLPFIIERRYYIVLPIAFVLMNIHTSAIFFLPAALLAGRNVPLTKKEMYVWFGVFAFLAVASTTTLVRYIEPLLIGDQFESYKIHYLEGDEHSSILNCTANAILVYFIVSWAYRNGDSLTKAQNTICRLSLLYLMCPFLGSLGRTRMLYYYIPFYIISLTYLMKDDWPVKWHKTAFISIAVAVMLYATFFVWLRNPHFVFANYHSIFE